MYDFTKATGATHNVYGKNRYSWTACEKGYVGSIVIDSTGVGDPIYTDLARQGMRVRPFSILFHIHLSCSPP